jgi:hypothetical protein
VEKSLESVRNAEKVTKPGEWFSSGERWLPALGKTPKGQKNRKGGSRNSDLRKESFAAAVKR